MAQVESDEGEEKLLPVPHELVFKITGKGREMSRYTKAVEEAKTASGESQRPAKKNPLLEWVTSDCRVKECVEGTISIDDGKYRKLWKCPRCDRSTVAAMEYQGDLEEWTDEEMEERLKDRKDVYYDKEYRFRRGKEVIVLLGGLIREEAPRVDVQS